MIEPSQGVAPDAPNHRNVRGWSGNDRQGRGRNQALHEAARGVELTVRAEEGMKLSMKPKGGMMSTA